MAVRAVIALTVAAVTASHAVAQARAQLMLNVLTAHALTAQPALAVLVKWQIIRAAHAFPLAVLLKAVTWVHAYRTTGAVTAVVTVSKIAAAVQAIAAHAVAIAVTLFVTPALAKTAATAMVTAAAIAADIVVTLFVTAAWVKIAATAVTAAHAAAIAVTIAAITVKISGTV